MANESFEQLWKKLLIYAPECPVPLAQEFVNIGYQRLLTAHDWTSLRAEAEFIIAASYTTGTVTVTNGSTGVVGSGTAWGNTLALAVAVTGGIQFFTSGRGPFYDIQSIDTVGQTLVLTRPYAGATASALHYDILQTYLTPAPGSFLRFESVMDRDNNWLLHTNYRQEQIDVWDAKRSVSGTPTILATAPDYFDSTSGFYYPRYEIWPRVSTAKSYSYRYVKKPLLLTTSTQVIPYPFSGYVLIQGALAELAAWPGIRGKPNPFYDLNQHQMREKMFQDELQTLKLEDDKLRQTAVTYVGWDHVPYAPIDAAYQQTHDVL